MAKSGRKANGKIAKGTRTRRAKADKADAVEMRKAPDLNLPEPVVLKSDDFKLHYKSMKSAKERMGTAKSLYDGCAKAAKKVSPDLLTAVKRALSWDGKDPEEIKADLLISGFVLKETECSVQINIFDTLAGDVHKQAYERGKNDAMNGRSANCPYPEGSDLATDYATGWRNGIGSNLGLTENETEAAVSDEGDNDGPDFSEVDEPDRRESVAAE